MAILESQVIVVTQAFRAIADTQESLVILESQDTAAFLDTQAGLVLVAILVFLAIVEFPATQEDLDIVVSAVILVGREFQDIQDGQASLVTLEKTVTLAAHHLTTLTIRQRLLDCVF